MPIFTIGLLVGRVVSTTTNDPGLSSSCVLLDRESVFADILPPDELLEHNVSICLVYDASRDATHKIAVTLAVDTFGLVLADNHIAQSSARLEKEDGVSSAALSLTIAGSAATIVSVPLTVKDLTGSDLDDLAVGLCSNSLRDTTSVAVAGERSWEESRDGSDDTSDLHGGFVVAENDW